MTNGQCYTLTLEEFSRMDACDHYKKDNFKYAIELFNGREKLTLDDILKLDISTQDKIWISDRIVPRREIAKLQVMWAYRVLPVFEREYPDDYRPRRAIQALETWIEDPSCENNMWLIAARQNMIHDLACITTGAAWSAANVPFDVTLWNAAHNVVRVVKEFVRRHCNSHAEAASCMKCVNENAWIDMFCDLMRFAKELKSE